ncbi:HlyIII channel protein [Coprinopsis cinerea AmutBmut pab1-1]|nr:HlyIII channel protein [Coprinopsis cinerea AmutBmut pab1-1]
MTGALRLRSSKNEASEPHIKAKSGLVQANGSPASNTISWSDLEEWQRDNEYIIHGYRRLTHSWKGCFHSVFSYLHNETTNIHSHLWGAVLFAYLLVSFYPTYVNTHLGATWKDIAVMNIFLFSAIFCLCGSALYHTSGCHSKEVATRCHALDYSGIVILIVGSFFPSIYYGFYCQPRFQWFYLTAISVMGVGAAFIVLDPEYAKPTHRVARTSVFIALGLCAIAPIGHLLVTTHGINELMDDMGFGWLVASGALYIIGAVTYAARVPERWSPGTFDYFGASHQLFHFCVVLAALAHFKSVLTGLDYRMLNPTCGI